ncbi:rac GTPase-activating protein 1 [Macrosteles quadrilineatus]|uniref:rac GTPase-activating protein 1 n=1 Tax=Macrosteles quadrilineatus TaxID=74068 RepID=UPI0023E33B98|nr:rac GTPase-activating protein 1 [Macrosteles quadrilineatus]XP_054273061.1 rac GTPase-activating protein 1 [Macrosteles quadrilineatus]
MMTTRHTTDRSLVSRLDEIRRLSAALNQSPLEEFLRFVTSQEECRLKWFECMQENRALKKSLNEAKKEINNLDSRLTTARKLLDQEKNMRHKAEEERMKTERQLQTVRTFLSDTRNHLHDETREKLKFLDTTSRSRTSYDCMDRLSAIHELDSTGSILSDLSFSRSEDDLDVESVLRKRRSYKKSRVSGYEEVPSAKRRRSHVLEMNGRDGAERMVATTTVTMEHNGSLQAKSHIETIPAPLLNLPTAPSPSRTGSMESVESGLSVDNNTGYTQATPHQVGVLLSGSNKLTTRRHNLVSKTIIRPEDCDVCQKRIKFGNTVMKCQNCRSSCHTICKDLLPLPCIEPGSTPISHKNMGVVADYAPSTPPMVPALVVHCIKEIETRGLNEHGIYRVPGSDREVRALKEKFMKGRGVPRLTELDIHVICGCLKDFLRNLKEPLVTHALWWQFTRASELRDVEERKAELYQAVSQLPQANRDTLAYLILHLLRVAEAKEANKMTVSNLATILGPTVVGYPSEYNASETYSQTAKAKLVLEQLLSVPAEYWYRVLPTASSSIYSTPLAEPPRNFRTPSTRSFKKLFDTPAH